MKSVGKSDDTDLLGLLPSLRNVGQDLLFSATEIESRCFS
jgi:hypothetical protein